MKGARQREKKALTYFWLRTALNRVINLLVALYDALLFVSTTRFQEYITERLCNSHMVSVPAIWIA